MKRGQVTLYIIIGLVLLIIFVFLSWVSTSIRKEDVVTRIQETLDLIRVQGKYYTYVTSCIEDSTEDALILAGYQGGAIWDYQADGTRVYRGPPQYEYGIYAIPHIVAGTAYNTSYWITAPELGSEIHKDVPWYPYGLTKLVTNPRILNPSYSNMFGNYPRSPSVPLCDYFGSNSRSLSNAAACESYDSQSPRDSNSLQQYIQRYIENRSIKCIKKLEDFPELDAMNVKIGNMTANFTFDSEGVLVNAVIPVVLRPSGYSSQISLVDFTVSLPVRLKQIHELASHLVLRDINDVFFGIAQDAPTVSGCKNIAGGNAPCLKTGMGVYKISNVCPTCTKGSYDDILVIRDTESLVHGEPYEFHIAIQNRVPALDLVREELGTGSVLYDFVAFEGQEIVIEPEGRDPDEDQHNAQGFMDHTYRYYGWKETENATFVCTSEPDIHCDESLLALKGEGELSERGLQLHLQQVKTTLFDGSLGILAPFGPDPWEIDVDALYLNRDALPLIMVRNPDVLKKSWALRARLQRFVWDNAEIKNASINLASARNSVAVLKAESLQNGELSLHALLAIFSMPGGGVIDLRSFEAGLDNLNLKLSATLEEEGHGTRWRGFAELSGNFGEMLDRAELSNIFRDGNMQLLFSGQGELFGDQPWWQGLNGRLRMRVDKGRILKGGTLSKFLAAISIVDLPGLVFGGRDDLTKPGLGYERMQMEATMRDNHVQVHKLAMRSSAMDIAGQGKMNLDSSHMDMTLVMRPFQNLDALLSKVPLIRDIFGGAAHSFMRRIYHVYGPVSDAQVEQISPEEAGLASPGIVESFLNLPSKWFGDEPIVSNP